MLATALRVALKIGLALFIFYLMIGISIELYREMWLRRFREDAKKRTALGTRALKGAASSTVLLRERPSRSFWDRLSRKLFKKS